MKMPMTQKGEFSVFFGEKFLKICLIVALMTAGLSHFPSAFGAEKKSVTAESEESTSSFQRHAEDKSSSPSNPVKVVPAPPAAPSPGQTLKASGTKALEAKQESGEATDAEADDAPVVLKPGHRILVRIYPEDEFIKGGEMEVNSEGNITLSLVGKVNVGGKKIDEAEKEIARMLDIDYLVNPEVSIELKREKDSEPVNHKSFLILGQVRKPGTYPIPLEAKKFTLLQAISIGGGFTEIANTKRVKVVRKTAQDRQTLQINVEDVFNGSSPDMEIQSGDVIHVPESIF
ncbi:MAG: polysaccharide export protein [Candidatus Omnitrophica bacterium]|nr:polysaccharide export protein [Candidatus Omnitrophota bacterium]